jgi:photosynthesis system II assembly factor YCF48-like protein
MPSDDRDQRFERALAQHLRGGSAQAHCPDAEILAAYHERNLSREEMARWKQHISACDACQEALAVVETTENQIVEEWKGQEVPVLEALSLPAAHEERSLKRVAEATLSTAPQSAPAPVPMRRRPALLRWAVPLGAVAAGVLVFIGIYEQRTEKMKPVNTEVARNQEPAEPGPVQNQLERKALPKPEARVMQPEADKIARQTREQESPTVQPAKPMTRAKDLGEELQASRGKLAGGRLEKKELSPGTPAQEIPAQPAMGAAIPENAPAIAAAPRPAPPPAQMAYGGGAGRAANEQKARADTKSAPPSVTGNVTVEPAAPKVDTTTGAMKLKQGISSQMVEVTGADTGLILTPDNRVFWKLQPAGTLQLTTDGGKDWKSLETGANEYLTAGFAPSSNVCWIAGRSGTLLLTKDRGRHWTRISTPIDGDLGGVRAADANHASIWDAAKRMSYQTSDGGATWKQAANE